MAFNRHRLGYLKYVMERSLTKTLTRKYRTTVPKVYRRYRAVLDTEDGPRRGLQVTVHRDGARPPLVGNGAASVWHGTPHHGPSTTIRHASGTETGPSSSNGSWPKSANYAPPRNRSKCTISGRSKTSTPRDGTSNPNGSRGWPPRHRKTLVVCRACHEDIHAGRPTRRSR